MDRIIIAKISEGLGNQLFMYANAYTISRKFDLNLCLDPYSGYYKNNIRSYMLNNFNISSKIASSEWIFSNNYRNLIKKIKIKCDFFKNKKSFLFESKDKNKFTKFSSIKLDNFSDQIYVDGNFESEKYFSDYRNDLLNEFSFKKLAGVLLGFAEFCCNLRPLLNSEDQCRPVQTCADLCRPVQTSADLCRPIEKRPKTD